MHSFSAFIFTWRMRLRTIRKHKLVVSLVILFLSIGIVFGPIVYMESWLDPFSTLNISNREFHPHAITMIGMLSADDPFHPQYSMDVPQIQDLLRNLQRATLLSSESATDALKDQKAVFYTLHRAPSRYHTEMDYALQYYPEKGIVRFGQQTFQVNAATIYAFTQINKNMKTGWWK